MPASFLLFKKVLKSVETVDVLQRPQKVANLVNICSALRREHYYHFARHVTMFAAKLASS